METPTAADIGNTALKPQPNGAIDALVTLLNAILNCRPLRFIWRRTDVVMIPNCLRELCRGLHGCRIHSSDILKTQTPGPPGLKEPDMADKKVKVALVPNEAFNKCNLLACFP
ncbi:hypothetical protein QE152_g7926 [Popillia japonica]|uniref:Uncharacterized protein n=1 Tax=Popillia japonica TaxID=7064 RepID=A0AAW1MDW3_POPJA